MQGPVLIDGVRLATRRIAASRPGPHLVFLHEGLGSIALWRDFPDRLCDATSLPGFLYDRAGHGASGPAAGPRAIDYLFQEADLLPRVLHLAGIDRAYLIGHSDGGTIALICAAAPPRFELRGLIAEAAHVDVEEQTLEGIRETVRRFDSGDLHERLARHHGQHTTTLFRAWSETWLHPQFRSFSITERLALIRCPVLAVQGELDPYATAHQLFEIDRLTPHAQTVLIPDAEHTPHREALDTTLQLMAGFIASCEPAA